MLANISCQCALELHLSLSLIYCHEVAVIVLISDAVCASTAEIDTILVAKVLADRVNDRERNAPHFCWSSSQHIQMNVLYRDGVEDGWWARILDDDFEGCLSGDWVEVL